MHLIEQYALSCGVKIDKPHIETCYYPVAPEKYITLHASSGMEAKNYDYYNDVVELILPYLIKANISIIQIGKAEDRKINNCIHYNGTTNLKQVCYLIENSMLHLGNDSFACHVASGFNKKLVGLYSVLFKECCGPYWGDTKNQIMLEPDRGENKPSFSNQEKPKSVNQIMPEQVAASVLNLLNIKHELNLISTLHIGGDYHSTSVSVIPNHVMPDHYMKDHPINILGNEFFDEQNILKWAYGRKSCIFLKDEMKIKFLNAVKNNIVQIVYEVNEETSPNYLKALQTLGRPVRIISRDEENINKLRLNLFDFNVEFLKRKTKKMLDNHKEICDNTRYNNSKIILSNGKKYQSKAAWERDIPPEPKPKIIDCPEFWEEIDTLKLYNIK